MVVFDPAPEGFEFDLEQVEAVSRNALAEEAPELWQRAIDGDLRWAGELDDNGVPVVVVIDRNGLVLGRMQARWRDVGGVAGWTPTLCSSCSSRPLASPARRRKPGDGGRRSRRTNVPILGVTVE